MDWTHELDHQHRMEILMAWMQPKLTAWVDARIDRFADRFGVKVADRLLEKSFGSFLLGVNDSLGKL